MQAKTGDADASKLGLPRLEGLIIVGAALAIDAAVTTSLRRDRKRDTIPTKHHEYVTLYPKDQLVLLNDHDLHTTAHCYGTIPKSVLAFWNLGQLSIRNRLSR